MWQTVEETGSAWFTWYNFYLPNLPQSRVQPAIFHVIIVNKSNKRAEKVNHHYSGLNNFKKCGLFQIIYFTFDCCIFYILDCWLCTWGRYGILVWNIGGDRRHTPAIVPTTHPNQPNTLPSHHQKIHLMKYQMVSNIQSIVLKKKDFVFS